MEKLRRFFIILLLVGGMFYLYSHRNNPPAELSETIESPLPHPAETRHPSPGNTVVVVKERPSVQRIEKTENRVSGALSYVLDEGIVVVQGDIAVGEIVGGDEDAQTGFVRVPEIRLWESSVIPVYIQPNLREPERVLRALELFSGSVIRFVPYTDQEDVMVFEESAGICKSYVGRIGGKQPLWISPNCAPDDIAHEILHALGFVHEQNRTDRDQYIELFPENIDEQYQDNFYLLPQSLMTVSGLASFDFESLMMYPVSMFSKNGQPTMQSRIRDQEIRPTEGLSNRDIERLNKAYGGR